MKSGLYEQIVNKEFRDKLDRIDKKDYSVSDIDKSTAPLVLSRYIESVVRKALEGKKTLEEQVDYVNRIIKQMSQTDEIIKNDIIDREQKTLLEVRKPNSPMKSMNDERPLSSLSSSYLFTGGSGFSLENELKKEIVTSDEIYMLVSFIRRSGISMIRESLKLFSQRGGKLKLICTTYMGATEAEAVDEISNYPGAEVKISYDTKHTRLHAKAYIFKRYSGFDTAYVGSSNLSKAAITDGREWNMKITSHDQSDVYDRMCSVFDTYWNSDEYERYTSSDLEKLRSAISNEKGIERESSSFIPDLRPYPFQMAILDKLDAERTLFNHNRNLVVAATGTGKTVISAFDYRRWCESNKGKANTLLFVAHREEILKQSLDCFRTVLRDKYFGSLYYGGKKPEQLSHLFASIQTLKSKENIHAFSPDHFDFIIVDEFHHAAADSYQELLAYFQPKILLGLTATPERMDGKDILCYFSGNRISAEIRLPEAIDRELLVPFHYYGIKDTVDLDGLKWTRGGYDKSELENVYVLSLEAAKKRADMILSSINLYVGDPSEIRCIGFCVSIKHAMFMTSYFSEKGLKAISVTSDEKEEERNSVKEKLRNGEVNFVFTVDLYNEGVDIPQVDTIMLLRPTESLTVFLQQLGRGLRTCDGKEFLTVLDFIGQSNKKYRFKDKFKALLSSSQRAITDEIKNGFVSVPSGCYIQLEKGVEKIVLDNIKAALGKKKGLLENIKSFEEDSEKSLTLGNFLEYYRMEPGELYFNGGESFSMLKVEAGVMDVFKDSLSPLLEKAMLHLSQIDSIYWIDFILSCLQDTELDTREFSSSEKSMLDMLLYTVCVTKSELDGISLIRSIRKSKIYREELISLFEYKKNRIDFVSERIEGTPLEVFAHYTRNQVLSSFGYDNPSSMREGVKYFKEANTDVFFVTLNKSEKKFSPSTMYKDYAVSPEVFHWESQNSTAPESVTGQRYINGTSRVLLFVRERNQDNWGTSLYTFLGPVYYINHKGSKPMAIEWKMKYRIPARFIRELSRDLAI